MRRALGLTLFVAMTSGLLLAGGCAKNKTADTDGGCAAACGCDAGSGCDAGCGGDTACGCDAGCGGGCDAGCGGGCDDGCGGGCADGCGGGCDAGCGDGGGADDAATRGTSMDEVVAGDAVNQARIDRLKASLRDVARDQRAAGNLTEAREAWRRILILDPNDAEARDKFRQVSVELGERVPVVTEALETTKERESARRQATQVTLQRLIAEAREYESNGDYDESLRRYERALSILEWYPYQADFPVTSDAVRGLIEQTRERQRRVQAEQMERTKERLLGEEQSRRSEMLEEERRQMQVWLRLASEAFDSGDYLLAQANSEKVLSLDPQNQAAKKLIRIAKETQYVHDRNQIREQFSDQWRTVMEQLEASAIPQPDVVRFPKGWAEISQRKPVTAGDRTSDEIDPRTQQILNNLRGQRLRDINWQSGEITFQNAIAYIRSVTGENFVLSQKVKEEKAELEVELQVDNVSVARVLNFITEPHEMAWKVERGVVMILDKEEALAKPVLRFYDVKDLVAKIQDFPGQEINLVPSKYQPPEEEEPEEPVSPFEVDQLIEVIQLTVDPPSWDTIEGASIEPKNNVLVIRTTPEVHAKIGALLSDLRKNTGILVSLEVRFLLAEDRFLRDIGVDIRGLGDQTGGVGLAGPGTATSLDDSFAGNPADPQGTGGGGVKPEPSSIGTSRTPGAFYSDGSDGEYKGRVENLFDFILGFDIPGRATASAQQDQRGDNSGGFTLQHAFLDDTQLEVILRAVEKSERVENINAPRLTVYDTQRANVSVMKQNSYVQDFDVEIAQAAAIGDPIVQTIRDGVILDVRPIVSADRRFITMELRPTVAELVRPIPTFQTSLGTGPPVTIQVPELAISRVRTTVTMPDGGTLLLGGIKFFRDVTAESGIPILSKIPIISFLFTRKAKTVQRRNLLILVKADVVLLEESAPTFGIH
ncbi:MAG: hypothetical protein V3T86_01735 [Planctomycetota bacterium]